MLILNLPSVSETLRDSVDPKRAIAAKTDTITERIVMSLILLKQIIIKYIKYIGDLNRKINVKIY